MEACPDCGSHFTRRIPRSLIQRFVLVNSKHILCSNCGERSLILWPGLFKQRVERQIKRPSAAGRRAYF